MLTHAELIALRACQQANPALFALSLGLQILRFAQVCQDLASKGFLTRKGRVTPLGCAALAGQSVV